jgi:hypothetical protein
MSPITIARSWQGERKIQFPRRGGLVLPLAIGTDFRSILVAPAKE